MKVLHGCCLLYTSHISVDAPFVEGEDNSLLDVLVNDDSPMADRSLVNESLAREGVYKRQEPYSVLCWVSQELHWEAA